MIGPLSERELDQLVKILGLLGSDHVGERAAAAAKAHKIIQDKGLTWGEVIRPKAIAAPEPIPPEPAWEPMRQPPRAELLMPHQREARVLLWSGCAFTTFERSVLTTLSGSKRISERQQAVLKDCRAKADRWRRDRRAA